jgi:FlaA1/EpsC-like NDP-sugar epimerase
MTGVRTPHSQSRVTLSRTRVLVAADVALSISATLLAYLARFETWPLPAPHRDALVTYALAVCVARILVFFQSGAYAQAWRYASIREAMRLVYTGLIVGVLSAVIGISMHAVAAARVPWSYYLIQRFSWAGPSYSAC